MIVQSVLFDKNLFSIPKAIEWLKIHNLKFTKIDEKPLHFRFRQINPTTLKAKGYSEFRTYQIEKGIKYILAFY